MFNFIEASPELAAAVDRSRLLDAWWDRMQWAFDNLRQDKLEIEVARLRAFAEAWEIWPSSMITDDRTLMY